MSEGQPFTPSIMTEIHIKCRAPYEYTYFDQGRWKKLKRHDVIAGKISWDVPYVMYDPMTFNARYLSSTPNADPDIRNTTFNFNALDGNVDRRSFEGFYRVIDKVPMNIRGRSGLRGRGVLLRYGPNHVAHPIVTRWKRNDTGQHLYDKRSERPILQFVSAKRKDTNEWALPEGLVLPKEDIHDVLHRAFINEALEANEDKLKQFFRGGQEIFKGYMDDPRNTDNAWIESVAFLFHDEYDLYRLDLAQNAKWLDVSDDLCLFANHKKLVMMAAKQLIAHWR